MFQLERRGRETTKALFVSKFDEQQVLKVLRCQHRWWTDKLRCSKRGEAWCGVVDKTGCLLVRCN